MLDRSKKYEPFNPATIEELTGYKLWEVVAMYEDYERAVNENERLQPVYARWLESDDGDGLICSNCSMDYCTMIVDVYSFKRCPNCGAYMEV